MNRLPPNDCEDAYPHLSAGFLLALSILTVAALALRIYRLDAESPNMDEMVQVEMYPLGLSQLIIAAADQGQPPLDYLIGAVLHRLHLAASDWWIRFPAAMFGAGCVFLFGWWIARIADPVAGLIAALLLAVCPLHVYMSQEARPYTIFFFFALAAILAYHRARCRQTVGAWGLFAALFLLLLMTRLDAPHFITAGLAAHALGAYSVVRCRADKDRRRLEAPRLWAGLSAVSIAYAIYNPIFGIVLDHSRRHFGVQEGAWFERVASQLAGAVGAIVHGYSMRTAFSPLVGSRWALALVLALFLPGLILLVRKSFRTRDSLTVLFSVSILPFPVLYAFSYACAGNAIPKPQYLLLAAAPLFACIALAISRLVAMAHRTGHLSARILCAGLAAAVAIPMAHASVRTLQTPDKRDWRGVMTYLRLHSQPGNAFAVVASDTVPSAFHVGVYGRGRYGLRGAKFLNIDFNAPVERLSELPWPALDNTVWILGYKDRMYLGYDQLPAPTYLTADAHVNSFNGLFLLEIRAGRPASQRLMEGLSALYHDLPERRGVIAPALFHGRYQLAQGDTEGARRWFELALRQCRSEAQAIVLKRDHLPEMTTFVSERSAGDSRYVRQGS